MHEPAVVIDRKALAIANVDHRVGDTMPHEIPTSAKQANLGMTV
jgi:hypothetical protein